MAQELEVVVLEDWLRPAVPWLLAASAFPLLAHTRHLHALIFYCWVWSGVFLGQLLLTSAKMQSSCWPCRFDLLLAHSASRKGLEGMAGVRDS